LIKNKLTKWETFERISKTIQLLLLIIGVYALFTIPSQIEQARQQVSKNSFDILWQIDTRLRDNKNFKISSAIDHKRAILTKSITEDDLDMYLSDLCSIEDVCVRRIITNEDVYEWFSDYIIPAYENPEIRKYVTKLRKEDPDEFHSFDELYNRVQQYIKQKNKSIEKNVGKTRQKDDKESHNSRLDRP